MEIEIVTTKKKISQSIIKQMARISYEEMEGAECLGYVLNIVKDTYKAFIIKLANGEYRMLEYSWFTMDNATRVYKRNKKGTVQIELGEVVKTQRYISFLNECGKTSQIFI